MPSPLRDSFVLFVSEPPAGSRRAVVVRGLPFTLGSSPEASVKLRAPGAPLVRVEASGPAGHRAVDLGGGALRFDGRAVEEVPLEQGTTFEVGEASVRFFAGAVEDVRRLAAARAPAPVEPDTEVLPAALGAALGAAPEALTASLKAAFHLERLAGLERRLAELMDMAARRA
ncbi:MAG: hypothetical protein HY721_07180 [Planctomycetes bacterium]|nr:hypothetical protein [Planctomycetota bacterium]